MRYPSYVALVTSVTAGLLGVSCDKRPAPNPSPSATPEASVAAQPATASVSAAAGSATPTVPTLMKNHFEKSADMKAALIRGDLDAFKKASVFLAENEISADLPVDWKQHVEGMRDSAHAGRDAADIDKAGLAMGNMGLACATCHEQHSPPKIALGEPPAEGSGAQLHMVRHQWAVDRMWEGLMAPNDAAWVKGAEVLADAPLGERAVAGEKSVPAEVGTLAKQVHDIANTARTAKAEDRAKNYGALLATCASCHSKLDVKLK